MKTVDFFRNSLLPITFSAKLISGLDNPEGGGHRGGGGFHRWWPNRRRSDVKIYVVTVFWDFDKFSRLRRQLMAAQGWVGCVLRWTTLGWLGSRRKMPKSDQKYYFSIRVMKTHKIYHQSGHYTTRIWRLWVRLGVAHHSTGSNWGGNGIKPDLWLICVGLFDPFYCHRPSLFQICFYDQVNILPIF